jgi:hypothetical protein
MICMILRPALLLLAVFLPLTASAHRRAVLPGPWLQNGYFDGEEDAKTYGEDIVTDAQGRWLSSDVYVGADWAQVDFGFLDADGNWIMGYANNYSCVAEGCDLHVSATQAFTPQGDLLMLVTYGENVSGFVAHGPGVTGADVWRVRADGTWQDSDLIVIGGVTGELIPRKIVATDDGGFVAFGTFRGDTQFADLPVTANRHLFLARFDASLQPVWARDLTPTADDATAAMVRPVGDGSLLAGGNTVVNGVHRPFVGVFTLDGSPTSFVPVGHAGDELVSLATAGSTVYALARTDAHGSGQAPEWFLTAIEPDGARWTRTGQGLVTALAADAQSIYVAGSATGSIDVAGRRVDIPDGQPSLFVGALEPTGAPRWVYSASSDSPDAFHVTALATYPTGEAVMEGDAVGNVDWREGFAFDIAFRIAFSLSFAAR